jgi:dipeptidase E
LMSGKVTLSARKNSMTRIILTIGGGGFTHGTDPELDEFCLDFLPQEPDIGYVGWANNDDNDRIKRFYGRFDGLARRLSHLPIGASSAEIRSWLGSKNLVYWGGGNTASLIAALQTCGALDDFFAANSEGCVFAGVSAGGVCWFDWILSDSGGAGFQPVEGLKAVSGGVCPHFSSEQARRAPFEAAVMQDNVRPAFAVDDGACLVSVSGGMPTFFSARPDRAAYVLENRGGRIRTGPLPRFG